MAYDLEEQEKIATLKAWWQQYGNLATWLLVAVLAAYSGWAGWQYHVRTQAVQASALYDELMDAAPEIVKASTFGISRRARATNGVGAGRPSEFLPRCTAQGAGIHTPPQGLRLRSRRGP